MRPADGKTEILCTRRQKIREHKEENTDLRYHTIHGHRSFQFRSEMKTEYYVFFMFKIRVSLFSSKKDICYNPRFPDSKPRQQDAAGNQTKP